MRHIILITFISLSIHIYSHAGNHAEHEKKLFFITPSNGDIVTNPINIQFGISGMQIVPAGVDKYMSGHHHLLVNIDNLPNMKMPIPSDKKHLHFGNGQTETTLELPKGKHTLQLLLGDHMHIPHDEPLLSEKIEITVR